ncbi:MAG: AMP-binding protein [Sphingomicrobium sp.]
MLVTRAATYAEVYDQFRWHLPERYNIAWDVCDRHAEANRTALIHHQLDGEVRSYGFGEIQRAANQLANLFNSLGLVRGDRVLLLLPQHPLTAIAHVACWKAGLISVPTSVLFGVDGVEYRLNDSGARVAISDGANVAKLVEAKATASALEQIFSIDGKAEGARDLLADMARASDRFTSLALTPDTPAFINYTSGTTGWPKGTLQGHRSMLGHMPGLEVLYDFFPQPADLLWSPADWSWLAGLMDVLMPAWFHGAPVLTFSMTGFDPERAVAMMGRHRVRNALLTPSVLKLIRQVPDPIGRHGLDMRSIISGSEAVGKDLLEEMSARLGVTINEGFGQTECNVVLGNCSSLDHMRIGALGSALPGHIAAIVDDDGNPLPPDTLGNIAFERPDPVMLLEYWRNPEATAAKFAGDWLLTGDLGVCDADGFFWFRGRADDVITSSGYRIGPAEIEDAIVRHPLVVQAAAIGVPDPQRTEVIKAFVVLAKGAAPSDALAEEIRVSVRDRLARHEYPRRIEFIDALPMTNTGKIMRRALRDREQVQEKSA